MLIESLESLEHLPVKISYCCETTKDSWKCDQWKVELSSKGGYHTFDYFTGLGLRTKAGKPKKPKIADVLHSLILDAEASEYNFDDWCNDFGYSSDSIHALNIYKACLSNSTALKKHLGREALDQIKTILGDN